MVHFSQSFMERIFLFVAPWLGTFQSQYDKQVPEKPSLEPPNVTANTADWGARSLPFCFIHSCLLSSKESSWSLPYSGHSGATEGGYPNLWAGIEVINKKPHEKFNFWFGKVAAPRNRRSTRYLEEGKNGGWAVPHKARADYMLVDIIHTLVIFKCIMFIYVTVIGLYVLCLRLGCQIEYGSHQKIPFMYSSYHAIWKMNSYPYVKLDTTQATRWVLVLLRIGSYIEDLNLTL